MSAFTVSSEHISAMLQATRPNYQGDRTQYYFNGEWKPIRYNEQEVGQILLDENYRSVNYRYQDTDVPPVFKKRNLKEYSMVEVLKAINCYEYQTCETPDHEETEAWAICKALKEHAIRNLTGYDEAAWSINC